MEHLSLEIFNLNDDGSQYATLPEDVSISITDTSELFASGDMWSHSFKLNVRANARIFGTSGDLHGGRLHEQIDKRKARLWVEGIPFHLGYLILDAEADVDENGDVDVRFESGQKMFDDMINGAKANQVPMMSDVRFGLALWRKRWTCIVARIQATCTFTDGSTSKYDPVDVKHVVSSAEIGSERNTLIPFNVDGEVYGKAVQQYPRMVFPKGRFSNLQTSEEDDIDCLNTDTPYDDGHPYCNIALCYQKTGYTKKDQNGNETNDYTSDPEAERGYEVMPANRVNSAPNFFVIYWLRSLMKHLGIYIEENQMMDVEDLRRLFFVNTKCAYKEPEYMRSVSASEATYGKYKFADGADLVPEYFGKYEKENVSGWEVDDGRKYNGPRKISKAEDCEFGVTGFTVDEPQREYAREVEEWLAHNTIVGLNVKVKQIAGMSDQIREYYDGSRSRNRYLHDAIATSDCFPDEDISSVIDALESGFGIRLLFSDDYKRVRIVLLRNIFRNEEIQEMTCDVISSYKTENNIRGFRMTYGDSEDTQFYYKGFADLLPHMKELFVDDSDDHDYSHWDLDADYAELIHKISAFDKTCYVTPINGNAYGIKIDKDAKRYEDLHPSLFEYAGFMDAEDGDCSGEEETIETINVGFKPAIMNDVNFEQERNGSTSQRFALFVDATMRPRRPDLKDLPKEDNPDVKSYDDSDAVYSTDELYEKHGPDSNDKMVNGDIVAPGEFSIASDMTAARNGLTAEIKRTFHVSYEGSEEQSYDVVVTWPVTLNIAGHINEGYRLYLQDNYEPNDDGVSPVEKGWGLTLGIMRGSGSDAYVDYEADVDDGEGNDTWEIAAGSSATAHPDTCDSYGNVWDYNGSVLIDDSDTAIYQLGQLWPHSNIDLIYTDGTTYRDENSYISRAVVRSVVTNTGDRVNLLLAKTAGEEALFTGRIENYVKKFRGMTTQQMYDYDREEGFRILVEVGSSIERCITLLRIEQIAFLSGSTTIEPLTIDNGVGSQYGRFSLKLRAEKLNPEFDKDEPESSTNRRYLEIENANLCNRGLMDQFYKEYSYWTRNARIAHRTVRMGLAQLRSIDKTKKVKIGDVTGFIRKMQYSIDNRSGLGMVSMEIMYI